MMSLFIMQPAISHQSSEWAYQHSQAHIPIAWYEGDRLTTALYYLLAIPLFFLFWRQYQLSPPLFWSMAGMGMYGFGLVMDTFTTWQCLRLIPAFEARGITYPLKERSWFMGEETSLWKQMINAGSLYSLAVFLASWAVPALGIGGGLAHLGAAANNRRQWHRLKLQLAFIDQGQDGGDPVKGIGPETH